MFNNKSRSKEYHTANVIYRLKKAREYIHLAEEIITKCKLLTGQVEEDFYKVFTEITLMITEEESKVNGAKPAKL